MTAALSVLLTLLVQSTMPVERPFHIDDSDAFAHIVPANARVRELASGYRFLEGPVWSAGRLLFSDIPVATIYSWSPDGGVGVFRAAAHQPNGNALDREGNLVTCEHESRLVSITPADGRRRVLVERFEGRRLNSPNDVVVRTDGTVWFTDPPYGLPAAKRAELMEYDGKHVFRFDPADGSLRVVAADFDMPNGLCFSPDERHLYIADSGRPRHVRRFEVTADGSLDGGATFCDIDEGVPDGMRIDTAGRLYVAAGDGVHIFAPDGGRIGKIFVPQTPANLAFGGERWRTLFITARQSLYAIDLSAAGMPPPP